MSSSNNWEKIIRSLNEGKAKRVVKVKNRNTAYETRHRLLSQWEAITIEVKEDKLVLTLT